LEDEQICKRWRRPGQFLAWLGSQWSIVAAVAARATLASQQEWDAVAPCEHTTVAATPAVSSAPAGRCCDVVNYIIIVVVVVVVVYTMAKFRLACATSSKFIPRKLAEAANGWHSQFKSEFLE
jgi:hypothetical protein